MASNNYKDHLLTERVKLKKVFYVIRPVLAARWAAKKQTPPPVSFHELLAGSELSPELRSTVDRLLLMKKDAGESEMIDRDPAISRYIETSLEELKQAADQMPAKNTEWSKLNTFFRSMVIEKKDRS